MRKVLVLALFLCLTFPVYAVSDDAGLRFVSGAIQGILISIIISIVIFIKRKRNAIRENSANKDIKNSVRLPYTFPEIKHKNTRNPAVLSHTFSEMTLTPWDRYKSENVALAREIEMITNENLRSLSEKAIFEKAATFKRMAKQYGCKVSELKFVAVDKFKSQFSVDELHEILCRLDAKSEIESKEYNIAKENTMSIYIQMWLFEYLNKDLST